MNNNLSAMNSENILSKNYWIIITEMKMSDKQMESWQANLGTGDEVYWNDPDEGICSGHATFVGHMSHNDPDTYTFYVDGLSVIVKDGIKMQVFTKELS